MALTARDVRDVEFRTAIRGYALDEVDDFLDLLAAALDDLEQGRTPRLSSRDVETHTFSTALRGYDLDDVDDFLDRAIATLAGTSQEVPKPPPSSPPTVVAGDRLRADRPVRVKGKGAAWLWLGGYVVISTLLIWGLFVDPVVDLPVAVTATVLESAALTAMPILATVWTLRREERASSRRAHTLPRLWARIGSGMVIAGLLALLAANVGIDMGWFAIPSPLSLIVTGVWVVAIAAYIRSRQMQGFPTSPIMITEPSLTPYSAGLLEVRAKVINTGSETVREPVIEPFRFVKQGAVRSGSNPPVAELRPGAKVTYRATIGPVSEPELWTKAINEGSWGMLATYRDQSGRQWEQLFYP